MTIVGLAQNFVGSNNINLLEPNGQFGTRYQGGKDAASARYIFTTIAPVTRHVFNVADDNVVKYLTDDGQSIEPEWYAPPYRRVGRALTLIHRYVPILPMVLVNGSDGIGTGWSSFIPNYNPTDIVRNLRHLLNDEELESMHPWYRGFTGTIEQVDGERYKCAGSVSRIDSETVEVTELPIRTWTQSYKELLESWVAGSEKQPALIKDYKEYHTSTTVHFIITLNAKGKEMVDKEGLEKLFRVTSQLSTSNMVCFTPAGKIKKYASPQEMLREFFDVRMQFYHTRKVSRDTALRHCSALTRLSNRNTWSRS